MTRRVLLPAALLAVLGIGAPADARPDRSIRAQLMHERAQWHAERRRLVRVIRQRPDVQSALTVASVVYRVPRRDLERVAWCESGHRPWARNGRYRGLLQLGPIFEGTPFGSLDVWDPYVNALAGAYIWRTGGQSWGPWACRP